MHTTASSNYMQFSYGDICKAAFPGSNFDPLTQSCSYHCNRSLYTVSRKSAVIPTKNTAFIDWITGFLQKMEIKTEADDVDEGISPNQLKTLMSGTSSKWTSPPMRKKLRSALSFVRSPTY